MNLDEAQDRWPEVVGRLAELNERVGALARNAVPTTVDDGRITLATQYPVHAHMLTRHVSLLEQALAEVLGGTWQVIVESPLDSRDWSDAEVVRREGPVYFVYTVGFPEDVQERLEAEATRRGVNPIDLIRQLVREALT